MATDASFFRWGAIIENDLRLGDFFSDSDTRPIHLTEAEALYRTLSAIRQDLENLRVDAYVDNQAVVAVWEGEGCRCLELTKFVFTLKKCITFRPLSTLLILSLESYRYKTCKLSPKSWEFVQTEFWPRSVDLMALDSNVMLDREDKPLRHFI